MQGGRANVGSQSVSLSGRRATRLGGSPAGQIVGGRGEGQSTVMAPAVPPASSYTRPTAATPDAPRSGSREIANVSGQGLIDAGQQTGTPAQPVQQPQPSR